MEYLVTFHSHFDANSFSRKINTIAQVTKKPVPRVLSSSCGTCVVFSPLDNNFDVNDIIELSFEGLYKVEGSDYHLIKYNE